MVIARERGYGIATSYFVLVYIGMYVRGERQCRDTLLDEMPLGSVPLPPAGRQAASCPTLSLRHAF